MVEISQLSLGTVSRSFSKTWTSACFLATFTDCWVKTALESQHCLKTLPAWYSHGRACAPLRGIVPANGCPSFCRKYFCARRGVHAGGYG
jgi:hypothetical protein